MVWREKRTVTAALTLHYNKMIFILEPNDVSRGPVRKQVVIHEYPDGRVQVRHDNIALPYRMFDKLRRVNQAAIADNKPLGQTPAAIRDVQAKRGPGRRNIAEPSRSAQHLHLFIVPQPDAEESRLAAAFALADAIKALEVPPDVSDNLGLPGAYPDLTLASSGASKNAVCHPSESDGGFQGQLR